MPTDDAMIDRARDHDLFGSTRAWALDDAVAHTNHGSFGAVTLATADAVEAARRRADANPMATWARDVDDRHAAAVATVADFVGADRHDLALVDNATVATVVALQVLPWRAGARIGRTTLTYPSVVAAMARTAAASGAEVVPLDLDPTASPASCRDVVVDALDDLDGVVVDAQSSATATWCDVDEVVAAARARDLPIVVDGAHEPGQVPLDVAGRGADAWLGNLHKWACAPKSLAAVVVDPRHHDRVRAPLAWWGDDAPFPSNTAWQGTADLGPLLVAEQVVAQATGILAHARDVEALVVAGAGHVADRVDGMVLPGHGWMRAIVLPRPDPDGTWSPHLEAAMATRGVEAKVTPVDGRAVLRLSAHAYSSTRDHDRLAEALVEASA